MKSIFNKVLIGALALLPLFSACQKEPAVGTPLYPVEEEYHGPMVYFYDSSSSTSLSSQVVKTPAGLALPEDTVKIYPQLTQAVNKDITISLVEDVELAEKLSNGKITVLPEGTLKFEVPSVVIKAGAKRSEEPIKVVLQECEAITNVSDFALSALRLSTDAEGVQVSKQYSSFVWNFTIKELNVKLGTTAGKTFISTSEYTLETNSWNDPEGEELTDGIFESGWYGSEIVFSFAKEETVTAVYIYPACYWGYYWSYSVSAVEIFTSNDGSNWKSNGELYFPDFVQDMTVPTVVEFYAPVKVKYLKVSILDGEDMAEIAVTK